MTDRNLKYNADLNTSKSNILQVKNTKILFESNQIFKNLINLYEAIWEPLLGAG